MGASGHRANRPYAPRRRVTSLPGPLKIGCPHSARCPQWTLGGPDQHGGVIWYSNRVVHVTLTNSEAFLTQVDEKTFDFLRDYWSYFHPGARFSRAYRHYVSEKQRAKIEKDPDRVVDGWDGKIRLLKNDGTVPAGLFRATKKELQEQGIKFKVEYDRPEPPKLRTGVVMNDKNYAYQNKCVQKMITSIPRGGGLILSATGTGKTAIIGLLASRLTWNILFVVDQVNLLYQTQKELASWLKEPVGVVGDQKYDVRRVTAATVQTLSKHLKDRKFREWYRTVDLVVVDEIHVQLNRRNFKVLTAINPIARFGLTATLQMSKKEVRMKAWSYAGPVLYRFPIREAQKKGVVSQGRAVQILFPGDVHEDYQEDYREEVVENEVKLKACSAIVRYLIGEDRRVIVLVSRIAHVEAVEKALAGIPHRLAYGAVDKSDRLSSIKEFEAGKIKLLIANCVFSKGINIKRVDAIVDMAEMKSKNDAVQKYGRGVRKHVDKKELLYIDFGTKEGRFSKAAKSRARALKAESIPVTKYMVAGPVQALAKIRLWARSGQSVRPKGRVKAKNAATGRLGAEKQALTGRSTR